MSDITNNFKLGIYPITGKIFSSPYDWGGTELIPNVLGFTPEPNTPYAEYWIGAHKRAPSPVELPDGPKTLEELIVEDPEIVLGSEVANKFGELPFLFKLAEARKMLSFQVHPNKQQAIEGFVQEEKTGIPSTELSRTYKDPNSKTEMVVAISDYWSCYGLLPEQELLKVLNETRELLPLIEVFDTGDYRKLYKHVLMDMTDQEVNDMLNPLRKRILPLYEAGTLDKSSHDYWAAKGMIDFNMQENSYDRGIFSIYFSNIVNLKPGQALYEAAGVLHAFLEGQYVEVMQNSDNIARAGMTNKNIDIEELMKLMIFEPQKPDVLNGRTVENEVYYDVPAEEYLVSKISLTNGNPYKQTSSSVEILLGFTGNATITYDGKLVPLGKGKSVLVTAGIAYEINGSENDTVYRTSIPLK